MADPKNFAVVIVKLEEDKYILMTDQSGVVSAFEGEHKAVKYFEDSYNRAHHRSRESSMSACINWMFFKPSILVFPTVEKLKKELGIVEKDGIEHVTASNVSGWMSGILLKLDKAKPAWERGVKPEPIDKALL